MEDWSGATSCSSQGQRLVDIPGGRCQAETNGWPVSGSSSSCLRRDGLLCIRLGMAEESGS